MPKPNPIEAGALVAAAICGAWRHSPPPIHLADQSLISIRQNILQSAAAGLVWWKVRNSPAFACSLQPELYNVARARSLRAAIHEANLIAIFRRLRSEGVEPILAKGWALSRLYPHPCIRAYGDHDLCVSSKDLVRATKAVESLNGPGLDVDFHVRFRELDSDYDALLSRSLEVPLQGVSIRVLSSVEHFQLTCIHTLYHGAWKPVWLCDVALLLEAAGPDCDPEALLGTDRRRADWILGAIFLAHRVLGASLSGPLEKELAGKHFPSWLHEGLLTQWGRIGHYMMGNPANERLRESGIVQSLRERWPNPIQATIRTGAGINRWPRFPLQVADVVKRARKLVVKKVT